MVGIAAMPLSGAAGSVPAAAPPSSSFMSPKAVTAYDAHSSVQVYSLMYTWHLQLLVLLNILLVSMFVCHMMPQNNNNRQPPAWSPNMEERYPFRNWCRDLLLWCIAHGDMEPHRQAASVLMNLRDGARELTREIPPNIVVNGGNVNGRHVDGTTYIMHILAERYGQLGEEARLSSITDLMNFNRVGNERVDDLITRFEIIRQRARDQGTLTMSIEGLAWILLKSCQINDTQLLNLLQPFGGRFPTTEQELRDLYGALRRMGQIMERRPNNIAQQLRSPQSGNLRAFMVTDGG